MPNNQLNLTRHKNMAAVKSKNNPFEIYIRKLLFKEGFRFRLHQKNILGKPDITLKKYKTLIFINGCFWHQHKCNAGSIPKTNTDFWTKKLLGNLQRDQKNIESLISAGWNIIIVWECSYKGKAKLGEEYLKKKLIDNLRFPKTGFNEIEAIGK